MQIGDVSRVSLGEFPTPIQKLDNLSNKLDGPEILIKRDDMNGLGTGGNKLRKLEFEMAKAKEEGATVLITTGAVQTNHGRLTLAAANKLNLKTVLVLTGEEPENFSGNILLDKIMGVEEIHFVEDSQQAVDQRVNSIEERLTGEGENPYYIPVGCDPLYGTLGYATCVMELVNQLGMNHKAPDYIVTASGTTSTQSGLVLGSRLFTRDQLEVVGISVSYHERSRDKDVSDYANQAADFLGLEESFKPSDIIALDDYVGEGYAVPTDQMRKAVELVARKESIVLDPVYTGKAMAGLLDLVEDGRFGKDDTVVFLHTGGFAGLFADRQSLFFNNYYREF